MSESEKSSRKKKRKKEKKEKEHANKKAKADEQGSKGTEKKEAKVQEKMIKDEELHCIVCFDFPTEGEIYQCKHGHLLCKDCHQRVIEGEKAQCPNCRVRMSRENPSRNRIAEMVLSSVMVDCPNLGCTDRQKFSEAKKHETEECKFRSAECKYHLLGCDWQGVQRDLAEHEDSCKIKSKSVSKLLKNVQKLDEDRKEKQKQNDDKQKSQAEVCRLLSSRCRDVVVRDVHLENDSLLNTRCSKTFTAFGCAWEVVLVPKSSDQTEQVGFYLRIVSSVKRRKIIKLFVLKGSGLQDELPPSVHKLVFKRKKKESDVIVLPFDKDRIPLVLGMDTLHFRMGFVDITNGRLSRGFTSLNSGGGEPSDDETSSSETDGYDSHDQHSHHHHDDYHHDDFHDDGSSFDSASELEFDEEDPRDAWF